MRTHGIPDPLQTGSETVELWGVRMRVIDPESPIQGDVIVQRTVDRERAQWELENLWTVGAGPKMFTDAEVVHATVTVTAWEAT